MHYLELDWRHSWTLATLEALDSGIAGLHDDSCDGFILAEHAEELAGLAFVALQAYVVSAIKDLRAIFPSCSFTDEEFRHAGPQCSCGITSIELIWAAANYYKHHDEWDDWTPVKQRRNTVLALAKIGISGDTQFPCNEVIGVLQGEAWKLSTLLNVVAAWRESWLSSLHGET